MKELDMTQEEVARKLGVTRGAVTHYLSGRRVPPLRQFQKLAAILKADPAWLQFGTISTSVNKRLPAKKETSQPHHAPIPILAWEQVANFVDSTNISSDEIKECLPDFYTGKSRWYALRIKGDAMTTASIGQKSFHEGDIIIVDPQETAKHGKYVIALLPKSKEATFKQYVIDGGVHYLKPLNPQYPIFRIDEGTHFSGVVIGCISLFR